jgi:hypothetical protein
LTTLNWFSELYLEIHKAYRRKIFVGTRRKVMKRLHVSWIQLIVIISVLGFALGCRSPFTEGVSSNTKGLTTYTIVTNPDPIGGPDSALMATLYAGKTYDVGTVEVWLADESLCVRYTTIWSLVETHFDVVADPSLFPQTNNSNPKPAQFKHKTTHDPGTFTYEFCVPIPEGDILYFAAHAEIEKWIDGACVKEESAWADGYEFPGANWATYFVGQKQLDPFSWMYGYWIQDEYAGPTSDYLEIREDGTYWWWINYDGSGGIDESGTWYVDSGLLIIVMEGMEVPTEVVKLSDDEFNLIMFGEEEHFYRKGTEPYWVFDLPPTPLPVSSDWTERIINDDEVQLFTFQAPVSGTYGISWKQAGDPDLPDYSAEIDVFAYRSDQETLIFGKEMSGYPAPMLVLLDMDETIFIIVEMDIAGTYGIRVLSPIQ